VSIHNNRKLSIKTRQRTGFDHTRSAPEMYEAYLSGRADKDPSELWYQEELGFFDSCIIPLAMKMCDCGVFGVASDDLLKCAVTNRQEWEQKGQAGSSSSPPAAALLLLLLSSVCCISI
jgi:hypothetical protein